MRANLKRIRRARAKQEVLGAWYSESQCSIGGLVEYRRVDGQAVFATEVGSSMERPYGNWGDYKYLGSVLRSDFVRRLSWGLLGSPMDSGFYTHEPMSITPTMWMLATA